MKKVFNILTGEEGKLGDKLNKVILGIMAVILVMLIAVSVSLFLYLKPKTAEKTTPDLTSITEVSLGDPIISNIKSSSSDQTERYIKLNVSIHVADTTLSTELATKTAQMRDSVYEIIGQKSYDDLKDQATAMPMLRKEIKHKLNKMFSTDKIVDVFLGDYTIQ